MSQPHFRRAVASDVPSIMEIRFSVKENVLSDPGAVTAEMCEEYLEQSGRGWVCELEGEVVAFSYASSRDSSIWALFVLPGYEGRGIGRRLLELAVEWLFSLGNDEIRLSTTADTRADRFYEMQGWERGEMKDDLEVWFCLKSRGRGSSADEARASE